MRALCLLGSKCPRSDVRGEIGYQWMSTSAHAGRKMLAGLTELKLHPTSSNTIQHWPTCPNMVFKRRQHVVANSFGWCCPNKLHPFKRAFSNDNGNRNNGKRNVYLTIPRWEQTGLKIWTRQICEDSLYFNSLIYTYILFSHANYSVASGPNET